MRPGRVSLQGPGNPRMPGFVPDRFDHPCILFSLLTLPPIDFDVMQRPILSAALGLTLAGTLGAQDAPFHASLRDRYDQSGSSYADVWGDGNFAYLARFGQSQVDIVNVSNPDNIFRDNVWSVASPNNGASAQDVKTGDGLLFIALESGGNDGVQIVDIRNPTNPQFLTNVDAEPGPYEFIHNCFYDNGWLYLCDSSNPSVAIIDLRSYNPNNPPANITSWTYELTNLSFFVHDITVANGRLYISGWDDMLIYDVSNLGNQAPSFLTSVEGISSHAVWPTENGDFVVTTEERTGGAIRLYEIVNDGGVQLLPRDSWVSPASGSGSTLSAHNPVIKGNRCYVSNYAGGALVLQIDPIRKTWERVASYDTSTAAPNGFNGAWGIYPLLGDDRVLVSDISNGLYTVDFSALELSSPAALPELLSTTATNSVTIDVTELGNATIQSVRLITSVNGGGNVATPMSNVGGTSYSANFPSVSCGDRVSYHFSATAVGGENFTWPAASGERFDAWAGEGLTQIFFDDFQGNLGWSVQNTSVSTGAWERGNPGGTGAQPESGDPDTAGVNCYMTELSGSSTSGSDLDGGPTRLQSPVLDFSAGDGLISYKRWAFNDDADLSDGLIVEVSNNGGSSWTQVENVTLKAGGWIRNVFRVSDYVTPTGNVRVRFSISDAPNDSITEGGVDSFTASLIDCSQGPAASATSRNGSGSNSVCYFNITLPKLGTNWDTQITTSGHAGNTSTSIIGYAQGSSGTFINAGEILLDLGSSKFFVDTVISSGPSDLHSNFIPNDPSLSGLTMATQALILGGGPELCNAIDLTVGI